MSRRHAVAPTGTTARWIEGLRSSRDRQSVVELGVGAGLIVVVVAVGVYVAHRARPARSTGGWRAWCRRPTAPGSPLSPGCVIRRSRWPDRWWPPPSPSAGTGPGPWPAWWARRGPRHQRAGDQAGGGPDPRRGVLVPVGFHGGRRRPGHGGGVGRPAPLARARWWWRWSSPCGCRWPWCPCTGTTRPTPWPDWPTESGVMLVADGAAWMLAAVTGRRWWVRRRGEGEGAGAAPAGRRMMATVSCGTVRVEVEVDGPVRVVRLAPRLDDEGHFLLLGLEGLLEPHGDSGHHRPGGRPLHPVAEPERIPALARLVRVVVRRVVVRRVVLAHVVHDLAVRRSAAAAGAGRRLRPAGC